MQENTDAIEAYLFRPTQFPIDGRRIPGFSLPHFELVDGGAGAEVAADEPGLFGVPGIGLRGGPLIARQCGAGESENRTKNKTHALHNHYGLMERRGSCSSHSRRRFDRRDCSDFSSVSSSAFRKWPAAAAKLPSCDSNSARTA